MRDTPSTDDVLLACVSGSAPSVRTSLDQAVHEQRLMDALRTAQRHQVAGYLRRAVVKGQLPSTGDAAAVTAWLRKAAAHTAVHQLMTLADLSQVAYSFTSANVPWLVVKGPVLSERVYPDPSLRPSRDLDVVVPASSFATAIDALEADGAAILDANWDLVIRQRRGQLHVRLPHGTTMDLHWHLINVGPVRETLDVSMASVWQDRRVVAIHNLQVDTLSVTDTVVHVGLHAALGGAWRLRWLNDLKLVIAHEPVHWAAVVARARQWRASRLLGVALMRSNQLLDADVPDGVITDLLGSRGYRATAAAFDRVWSPMTATHPLAPAQLWPQLVRDTGIDIRRAVAWRLRRRTSNGIRGFWHGREQPEEMEPSGGDRGRAQYLRLVQRGELD